MSGLEPPLLQLEPNSWSSAALQPMPLPDRAILPPDQIHGLSILRMMYDGDEPDLHEPEPPEPPLGPVDMPRLVPVVLSGLHVPRQQVAQQVVAQQVVAQQAAQQVANGQAQVQAQAHAQTDQKAVARPGTLTQSSPTLPSLNKPRFIKVNAQGETSLLDYYFFHPPDDNFSLFSLLGS